MKVLVLGAGKMVESILEGLKNETDLSQFYIYSPSGVSSKALAKKIGCHVAETIDEVANPEWIWIGCKPQQLKSLEQSFRGKFPQVTFVSMLAAISEADQLKILGVNRLIRIMPNLPIRFKKGITLITSRSASSDLKRLSNLFSLVGLVKEVNENQFEELTLLTGSGPALFYEFTKNLGHCFSSLPASEVEELSRAVLQGAGVSAEASGDGLKEMIDHVTSKAGVTIAVLEKWREEKLEQVIKNGVEAGLQRTFEIKDFLRHN